MMEPSVAITSAGDRRSQTRIEERTAHQIDEIHPGQQEAGTEGGRIQFADRNAEHRAHHDQHHRGRNQDAERAAGGDRACGQAGVVAGFDHHRAGHDAEHGHRRADDTGRHREHRRRQNDHGKQRAADRRQQVAERPEQAFHQARLLGDEAHQHEQRDCCEQFLLHQADGLEIGKIEDCLADPEIAERQRQEEHGEADGEANEYHPDQHEEHDQAQKGFARHRLDLYLFLVLKHDPGRSRVQALDGFRHALDEQQQAGQRHDHLERP